MKFSKLLSLTLSLGAAAVVVFMTAVPANASDAVKGEKLAKACKACHTLDEGGKNKLGPNLFGILGKEAGKIEGYKYSKAMAASGITWDAASFTEFLIKPKKFIKGTKMSFKGFKKAEQRADILAYFETLGSTAHTVTLEGDPVAGEVAASKHCTVCHTFEKGGKTIFGPNLFGAYGAKSGYDAAFDYSDALKNSGYTWTEAKVIEFIANPVEFMPGTKAQFPGVKSAKERADIVAYMKTLQ